MIAGSLLLILAAGVMLVGGLVRGSDPMLYGSIVASVFAAVTLVVGVRKVAARRVGVPAGVPDRDEPAEASVEAGRRGRRYASQAAGGGRRVEQSSSVTTMDFDDEPTLSGRLGHADPDEDYAGSSYQQSAPPYQQSAPPYQQSAPPYQSADYDDGYDDTDPPDEPPAQLLSAADAARVARMTADVLVVDGRPRYHLAGCVHLLGRGESEPLPVAEAVELGFTPCSLCEPDSALLAEARRV